MRVSDRLANCVAFVSRYDAPDEFCGTAFIVGIPFDSDSGLLHLVTARHVAQSVGDGNYLLTLNDKDGNQRRIANGGGVGWFYHPTDPAVDVAVIPFASSQLLEYEIQHIPVELFATDQRIERYQIGLGDEIVIVGLFTGFPGVSRITPIVRTGNIAMMPKDRYPTDSGEMEIYLAEGRSIGGLSGSPVFCRDTVRMHGQSETGGAAQIFGLGGFHLLGLVHGHWDLSEEFGASERREIVNMGVSVVIPAKVILEVLNSPELVRIREEAFRRSV